MPSNQVINVVVAGLGGQGVLKASGILADAVFRAGLDVKKSEIHGMSQRGGSVSSDVRFGQRVYSPMVPMGQADYLVVLAPSQVEVARPMLKAGGVLIQPSLIDETRLGNKKSLNVALLGALARHLDIADNLWHAAITAALPEKLHPANLQAFAMGRNA
jgi:indolepyruvate ferredoxin oxidoreductase beta subunit